MTDTSKAAETPVNANVLDQTPPELNPDRFLGMQTKDGETVPPETKAPTPGAKKDTNGKTAAIKPTRVDGEKDGEKPEGDDNRPSRSVQKRIDQATARQRAAERQADILSATNSNLVKRLEALEAKSNGTVVDKGKNGATSGTGEPKPSDYEYGELDARYIKDLARYEARAEYRTEQAKSTSETARVASEASAKERATRIETWVSKAPAELDDFDEVVYQGAKDGLWPLSETIGDLLIDSDVGHQIAYALASDPKKAREIAAMKPSKQAAWFGVEEARLTAETESSETAADETHKPLTTKAPVPSTHRSKGSGSSNPVAGDTNDFAAFERLATKAD